MLLARRRDRVTSIGFKIAKDILHSQNVNLALDPVVIEDICLSCSQEFYENASSGNYHFGDMKLAYEWWVFATLQCRFRSLNSNYGLDA